MIARRVVTSTACLLALLALLALPAASAIAAGVTRVEDPESLDARLDELLRDAPVPGVAVVVVEGNETVAAGCAGVRKRGSEAPATLDDRWHLGSCTKAMTATVIASLVERGRLRWDLTLAEALPDLAGQIHEKHRDVTLEQLLANRGGMPGEAPDVWRDIAFNRGDPVEDRRRMTRLILAKERGPAVGEYEYSNFGFAIAGHVAEAVTGTPWEDLMHQHLFQPLGMDTAGFGVPWEGPDVTDPWGHRADGTPVPPGPFADNPSAIAPAGTVHASIGDWAKFIAAHLGGDDAGSDALHLPREAFLRLHGSRGPVAPGSPDGYAAGWIVTRRPWARGNAPDDAGRVLTHAGSNTMFFAVAWVALERDLAVLACTNQAGDSASRFLDTVVATVLRDHLARGDEPDG